MPDHNVVAVGFADRANAFQALSELKGAALEGRVDVMAASVVLRDDSGRLQVPEGVDDAGGAGALGGGITGLLVGVIGGPVGMLFGWTSGLLIGSAYDARRAERSEGVLAEISSSIPPGGTALVAEVSEYTPEVIDVAMARLGGVVLRRDAEEVLAELEAAEQAYEQARKDARRLAREEQRAERRADVEERKDALKHRLGLG